MTTAEAVVRTPTWMIVLAATAVALLVGFYPAISAQWTKDGVLEGVRLTARWALPLFLLAWSASSLAMAWPGGWRAVLLRRRRAVGLAFAAVHFVHLGFVILVTVGYGVVRPAYVVAIGGAAYVLIALMALTSTDAAIRAMGPGRWRALHTAGGWLAFLIFTNSYVGRIKTQPDLAAPALTLIVAALALRTVAVLKRRQPPRHQAA